MNGQTGTVTDPFYGDVVSVLSFAIAFVTICVAVGALIREGVRRYRAESAQLDRNIAEALSTDDDAIALGAGLLLPFYAHRTASTRRPLPLAARACWTLDIETPIGNQLLREYVGAVR